MRRRWIVIAELLCLAALATWLGLWMYDRTPRPDDAVSLKVQLPSARDQVYLARQPDGSLRYQVVGNDGAITYHDPDSFAKLVYNDQHDRGRLAVFLNVSSPIGFIWVTVGLLGQVLFTGRMVVQWIVSTKAKKSVVPPVFWWMSLVGSTMLLVYFAWRRDPVGILGQAVGWTIYIHNLWLIYTKPAENPDITQDPAPEPELNR